MRLSLALPFGVASGEGPALKSREQVTFGRVGLYCWARVDALCRTPISGYVLFTGTSGSAMTACVRNGDLSRCEARRDVGGL